MLGLRHIFLYLTKYVQTCKKTIFVYNQGLSQITFNQRKTHKNPKNFNIKKNPLRCQKNSRNCQKVPPKSAKCTKTGWALPCILPENPTILHNHWANSLTFPRSDCMSGRAYDHSIISAPPVGLTLVLKGWFKWKTRHVGTYLKIPLC